MIGETTIATIAFRTFKLEFAILFSMAVLIAQVGPKLSTISRPIKWAHFGLVGLYSLVGIAAARFVLFFCLGHEKFVETFSQPNVLGVGPVGMQWLAFVFAVSGSLLFVSSMMLGIFRPWAKRLFVILVLPCGVMYPTVMLTALGTDPHYSVPTVLATLLLTATGVVAVFFYGSKHVAEMEKTLN